VAVPPGQAKYVTCVRGALRGIVVDLRVGSPAFGAHHVTLLDAESGRCMYVPEGVGHGFLSLTDDACICYVVSTPYVPGTQVQRATADVGEGCEGTRSACGARLGVARGLG
jgi:NDP-hexose 5-epimerase